MAWCGAFLSLNSEWKSKLIVPENVKRQKTRFIVQCFIAQHTQKLNFQSFATFMITIANLWTLNSSVRTAISFSSIEWRKINLVEFYRFSPTISIKVGTSRLFLIFTLIEIGEWNWVMLEVWMSVQYMFKKSFFEKRGQFLIFNIDMKKRICETWCFIVCMHYENILKLVIWVRFIFSFFARCKKSHFLSEISWLSRKTFPYVELKFQTWGSINSERGVCVCSQGWGSQWLSAASWAGAFLG